MFKINGRQAVLEIYGPIGADIFEPDAVSATSVRDFIRQCQAADVRELELRIDSPGGSVFEGQSIYICLVQSGLKITAFVDGLAASAASLVLMAAQHIVTFNTSEVMIHETWSGIGGTADELTKQAALLRKLNDVYAEIYASRTGNMLTQVRSWMQVETWFFGQEIQSNRFADEYVEVRRQVVRASGRALSGPRAPSTRTERAAFVYAMAAAQERARGHAARPALSPSVRYGKSVGARRERVFACLRP